MIQDRRSQKPMVHHNAQLLHHCKTNGTTIIITKIGNTRRSEPTLQPQARPTTRQPQPPCVGTGDAEDRQKDEVHYSFWLRSCRSARPSISRFHKQRSSRKNEKRLDHKTVQPRSTQEVSTKSLRLITKSSNPVLRYYRMPEIIPRQ